MAGKKATKEPNNVQLSFGDYQLPEVSVRLVLNETSSLYSTSPLTTPEDAVKVMGDLLRGMDRETVCVVNMDNKLRPINSLRATNYNVVSIGDISSSMVPVANVFKTAILQNSAACILLHSHPSGDSSPSQEDFEVTKRLVQAGKLFSIPLIDHIIVGAYQGEMFSFRENYPDMFYADPDLSIFPEIDPSKGWSTAEKKAEYKAEKTSVLGRLSDKKTQAASKGNAVHEPKKRKQEYSID